MMLNQNRTQTTSDRELIRRAGNGDRFSAERLMERYRNMVLHIASRALRNPDDAHDVTQEALVYALQRLPEIRDGERFAAYLRHVTLTLCAEYRRRRGTRRLGEPLVLSNEAAAEVDYAQQLVVRQALSRLSDAQRTTLLLHYIGGWSLDEVADLTATPRNTVRSRLMSGKRLLRAGLQTIVAFDNSQKLKGNRMSVTASPALTETQTRVLQTVFPGARILSVQKDPEPWMPFSPRVRLSLADQTERTVDFRWDIDNPRAALAAALEREGIPGPRLLHPPVAGVGALCELPRGENLSHWALGGTPHRIQLATKRAFEGIDLLQNATRGLLADPVGATLLRRTLTDEIEFLLSDEKWNADSWMAEEGKSRHQWLQDPWFTSVLKTVRGAVADIQTPLVYTHYTHFFPQGYRIEPGRGAFDESLGWPGDARYQENPLVEISYLFGGFGDPLLGLTMVWLYDCYPFVHTGFVEEFLWRRDVSRREFAPRLALKGLHMIARDLPLTRPTEGSAHWDRLRGWVEQALAWM